ncbi:MAG TPA: ATP-grasp domain-containing protein, partial [Dehalococcoidales bacterium]|nr:ATP-grasp domain-containing protein [Dehalococcoidales bacterium]
MKLFEFEAKNILRKYGIATPRGDIARDASQAELAAREIGKPVMLKAQVLISGRGKAGGIIAVEDASEARKAASNLIGSKVKGAVVRNVLVEEKVDITEEFYASVAIDRQARKYVVLASTSGGIDIEQIAL